MRFAPSASALCGVIALSLSLSACDSADPAAQATDEPATTPQAQVPAGVQLTDAEVRLPAVSGRPGVAYFSVATDSPRKIVSVTVAGAARAEMHETKSENGVKTMAKLAEVAVQPGTPVAFTQGGNHVMLFDVDKSLSAGGTTDLVVKFDDGETASIKVKVVGAGGIPPVGKTAAAARTEQVATVRKSDDKGNNAPVANDSAMPNHDMAEDEMSDHEMIGHDMEGMAH